MESTWIKWIREGINIANGNTKTPPVDKQPESVLIDLDAYADEAGHDDQTDATVGDDGAKVVGELSEANTTKDARPQSRSTLTNFALYKD